MKITKMATMMAHAIEMSYYKYGTARKTYPELAQAHKCIEERLDYYENGRPSRCIAPHNKDYVIDVANFAMLEAMFPEHPHLHFTYADAITGWKADFSTKFIDRIRHYDSFFQAQYADSGKTKVEEIKMALARYRECNEDILLDYIGWLAIQEFFAPTFDDAFHDRNIAGEKLSPGLAGGISYKQLMEGEWK